MLVFLDRDGVLNEDSDDYIKSPSEFIMIPGSAEAVAKLNAGGHQVVIVTNQSGLGRGLFDENTLNMMHDKLRTAVGRAGGHLDAIFYCSDLPWEATERRKPGAGMLKEALAKFPMPISECVLIGDSLSDLQAAEALGIRRILVRTGKGAHTQAKGLPESVLPVSVHENLDQAVSEVLGRAR
jgi:D-glycero-D-manno-heptose 1,7-bisphosphate phosphatase